MNTRERIREWIDENRYSFLAIVGGTIAGILGIGYFLTRRKIVPRENFEIPEKIIHDQVDDEIIENTNPQTDTHNLNGNVQLEKKFSSLSSPRVSLKFVKCHQPYFECLCLENLEIIANEANRFTLRDDTGIFLSISSEMFEYESLDEYFHQQTLPKEIEIKTSKGSLFGLRGLFGSVYDSEELKTYHYYVVWEDRVFLFYSNQKLDFIESKWISDWKWVSPEKQFSVCFESSDGFQVNLPRGFVLEDNGEVLLPLIRVIGEDVERFQIQEESVSPDGYDCDNSIEGYQIYSRVRKNGFLKRFVNVTLGKKNITILSETKLNQERNMIKEALETLKLRQIDGEGMRVVDTLLGIECFLPPSRVTRDGKDLSVSFFDMELDFTISEDSEEKPCTDIAKLKDRLEDEIETEFTLLDSFEIDNKNGYTAYCVVFKDPEVSETPTIYLDCYFSSKERQYELFGDFPAANQQECIEIIELIIESITTR